MITAGGLNAQTGTGGAELPCLLTLTTDKDVVQLITHLKSEHSVNRIL